MNGKIVVYKTPRGRDEISTRAHELDPLSRRLLIMADGMRTVADLAAELQRAPDDPALADALEALLAAKYLHTPDGYDDDVGTGRGWLRRGRTRAGEDRRPRTMAAPLGTRVTH